MSMLTSRLQFLCNMHKSTRHVCMQWRLMFNWVEAGTCLQTLAGGDPLKVMEMLDKLVPQADSTKGQSSSNASSQQIASLVIATAVAAVIGGAQSDLSPWS